MLTEVEYYIAVHVFMIEHNLSTKLKNSNSLHDKCLNRLYRYLTTLTYLNPKHSTSSDHIATI